MKQLLLLLSIILLFTACSYKHNTYVKDKSKVEKLSSLISNSSLHVNKIEAQKFSKEVITHSLSLAKKYEVHTTALIHNTLINLEFKQRGLCYHYANDLIKLLKLKEYKSFKIQKIIANRGEYFEHTALLLTRNDITFKNSIVLDAWRNTGELYFSKVINDNRYKWELK